MAPHPKPKATSGKAHFEDDQRVRSCLAYHIAHKEFRKCEPDPRYVRSGKRGREDPVWSRAYELYEHGRRSASQYVREATRRQFKDCVSRWYERWHAGEVCKRLGNASKERLGMTEVEVAYAVEVISTPVQKGRSFVHFETIAQALASDEGAELRAILKQRKVSTTRLHKLLVDDLKLLTHNVVDSRPELPKATLESREKAADIWAGRKPWTYQYNATQNCNEPHYFDWDYYFNFTFMIDACSFEDGPASGSKKQARNVYRKAGVLWGPEIEEPPQSIVKGSKLMYYTIIHPHGGVVCGPDLVYTGSKVPVAQAGDKADVLHDW